MSIQARVNGMISELQTCGRELSAEYLAKKSGLLIHQVHFWLRVLVQDGSVQKRRTRLPYGGKVTVYWWSGQS